VSGAQHLPSQTNSNQLIKQCYSVIWNPTSERHTHWHLIAYSSVASKPRLQHVRSSSIPCFLSIIVPSGQYLSHKKFKAERRQLSESRMTSRASSSNTTQLLTAPTHSNILSPLSMFVSSECAPKGMSQPRTTSLRPVLKPTSTHCDSSDGAPPHDPPHNVSPKSQLIPLLQLDAIQVVPHRSEVDRWHIAALDGCRSSISKLPSSHTTLALPLRSMY